MALIDKASLLMVPSTYEDGTLYNVLPSGNKAPDETGNHNGYDQTRADFTFSRGSNLAATRVNADGLIEKGRENLFTYSNDFSTTWNTYNASRTSGAQDYEGGTNAYTLAKTGSYGLINQYISNTGVHTFSIYAKAGTLNWMALTTSQAPYSSAYFDLENGVLGSLTNAVDSNIESIGDGWYRCSLTSNVTAAGNWRIYPADSEGGLTNSNLGNIVIFRSQLEKGLVATDYIETGSSTATAGILEDMPRINYDANGENGALLLEPSRTNLVTYSEYFGSYSKSGGLTLTHNYGTSPEGVQNSTRMQVPDSSNYYILTNSIAATAGTYVISVYIKGTSGQKVQLYSDGSAGGSGFTVCELTGDWKRFERVVTTTATGQLNPHILFGYGVSPNAQDIEVWGWQCEAGSHVSSYIPTHGAAVTRGAEGFADLTLNYGTSFTMMFDIDGLGGSHSNNFILRMGTTNPIYLSIRNNDRKLQWYSAIAPSGYFATPATKKIAISCNGTSWIWASDGATGTVTATGSTDLTYMRVKTDGTSGGGLPSGLMNQLYVSDEALSASELATLTTL